MTAQHREGKKKKENPTAAARQKQNMLRDLASANSCPSLLFHSPRSHSNPVSPRKPLGQLTRTPGVRYTRPVHFTADPLTSQQKADHVWGGAGEWSKKKSAQLAGPWRLAETKRRQGGKHTVPAILIPPCEPPGYTPGHWALERSWLHRAGKLGGVVDWIRNALLEKRGQATRSVQGQGLEAGCGARASRSGSGGGRRPAWSPLLSELRFQLPGWPWQLLSRPHSEKSGTKRKTLGQKGSLARGATDFMRPFSVLRGHWATWAWWLQADCPDGRSLLRRTASVSWALTRNWTWVSGQSHLSQHRYIKGRATLFLHILWSLGSQYGILTELENGREMAFFPPGDQHPRVVQNHTSAVIWNST